MAVVGDFNKAACNLLRYIRSSLNLVCILIGIRDPKAARKPLSKNAMQEVQGGGGGGFRICQNWTVISDQAIDQYILHDLNRCSFKGCRVAIS